MHILDFSPQTDSQPRPQVVTIGNFDGLHLGHQQLLDDLVSLAKRQVAKACVVLFEPQPREFFAPKAAPARLMRLQDKLVALRARGVNKVACLAFNASLAQMPAPAFIEQILVQRLQVSTLLIGDDFRFGHKRKGDWQLLQQAADNDQFTLQRAATVMVEGERASSTRIRQLLADGNLDAAQGLLGVPYSLTGKVVMGAQMGRTWGVPTANVHLHRLHCPVSGVFAVKVRGLGTDLVSGVANVGTRPTVMGLRRLLEVHLFDFNEIIYGRKLQVLFLQKIRDEKKFDDLKQLQQQIREDIQRAQHIVGHT